MVVDGVYWAIVMEFKYNELSRILRRYIYIYIYVSRLTGLFSIDDRSKSTHDKCIKTRVVRSAVSLVCVVWLVMR